MPTEPDALGLLALIRLHRTRATARFDTEGRLVLLRNQDRTRWNSTMPPGQNSCVSLAARRRPGRPASVPSARPPAPPSALLEQRLA